MKTILIIEDDIVFSRSISNWLVKKGMKTECVATLANARKAIGQKEFDLILADLRLPDGNSTSLLKWMNEILDKNDNEQEFYRGESPKAHEMYRLIEMIACADISVLLRGASGTGKEHIAAEIHARSHRKNKPYLAIDCGAISDELAASEFFGHQKGAFTGAESDKVGLFRAVNGGTLFLDEIGNLSYKSQMLLLRALQEKRCKPVGSTKEYSFDIRLVAATNENLEKAIGEGRFREDLFHRLNEFTLRIPTLAECREDILPLAYFFLKLTCAKAHKSFRGFDRLAEAALLEYPWPGNIRELKNVIGRAVLICQEQWISVSDLNLEISLPKEEETQWTEEEKEKALLLQTLERRVTTVPRRPGCSISAGLPCMRN